MIEHRVQPHSADVAITRSINRVTESHVVGRHRLRDRSRRAANVEKSPRDLLTGADFRKRPVLLPIEINFERFPVRPDIHLRFHSNSSSDLRLALTLALAQHVLNEQFATRKWRGVAVSSGRLPMRTPTATTYIRTCSELVAGIPPRKLFGSAAYIQSPRRLRTCTSLPAGNVKTRLAVSAVAMRASALFEITTANARPSLPRLS